MTFSFLMSWREGVLREQIRFSADNLEKKIHMSFMMHFLNQKLDLEQTVIKLFSWN